MSGLIAKLEDAEVGSRELDQLLGRYIDGLNEGSILLPNTLPYTTSLDAKLPWENIIRVRSPTSSSRHGPYKWEAFHATDTFGQGFYGEGHTEVLARRIAALNAREPE